jgi:cobalt-zinc-cadmium efflux system membrane fusion protein
MREWCATMDKSRGNLAKATALALALSVAGSLLNGCGPKREAEPAKGSCAATHGGTADPCAATTQDSHAGHKHGPTGVDHAAAAAETHAGHAHGSGSGGHGAHAGAEAEDPSPAAIGAMRCEHDTRIVDCDECRYEAGVVKLGSDVAGALVKTAPAEEAELASSLRLTGVVARDATAVVEVVPLAPGTVTTVHVRLGQMVRAGETLAVLHSSAVGEAKAAYLEARALAEVATQERDRQRLLSARLATLLAALPDPAEVEPSRSGTDPERRDEGNAARADAEAGSSHSSRARSAAVPAARGEPLGEWRSRLTGAAARRDHTRALLERETALVHGNASSRAELEAARYEFRTAATDYAALVEEAQLSLSLEQLRADNTARQAEVRLLAAEQRLHILGLDRQALERTAEMTEQGDFAGLSIRAPRAGTITALDLVPGRFADATQSLCTIADLGNLWVWCDLYERDVAQLHRFIEEHGTAQATVRVAAFPDTFAGVVDLVGSEVDERTRTIKVRVQVPAAGGRLKPGMFATVDVALPTGRTATLVPKGAILTDEGRTFVFQHWQDELWLRRHVVVGDADGERVEIVHGVAPGASVVVSGGFLLKSDVLREKMGAGCAD